MRHLQMPQELMQYEADVVNENVGFNAPLPMLEKKWVPILEEGGMDISSMRKERVRLICSQMAVQEAYFESIGKNPRAIAARFMTNHEYDASGDLVRTTEQPVNSGDIDPFTTQSIAYVPDLFEAFDWLDVVTTRQMLGPRAFVHSRTFTRCDASDFYASGTALNSGIDPSFTECPEECSDSNRICVQIDSELIEAECRSVAAEYCIPANYHVRDQYGSITGSLDSMLDEGMVHALQRDIQADGLATMVAGAGATINYAQTPPAGGFYATADPDLYRNVLWKRVTQADIAIRGDVDSFQGATDVLVDSTALSVLQSAIPFELSFDTRPGGNGPGAGNQMTAFQGTALGGRYRIWHFTNMPADTMLVMKKNDADPTFIYAPWIPFTDLGTLTYPKPRRVEKGMITLYAQRMLRSGAVREINITA